MNVSVLSQKDFRPPFHTLEFTVVTKPYGEEVSLWDGNRLCAMGIAGKYSTDEVLADLRTHFPSVRNCNENSAKKEVQELLLVGTDFQIKVWQELLKIPLRETRTYQQIAKGIGHPKAVRAVGTAIGRNPISIYVPCHRVLRSDGSLGGYHWGLDVKNHLLKSEGVT